MMSTFTIFSGAIPLMSHFSVGNSVPVGVYLLNCTGEEQNWTDCNYSIRRPSDSCDSTASISCQGEFLPISSSIIEI